MNRRTKSIARGFTLVEMLVVLAIIVVITTIALTSQSTFNKTLILANTAYDVALSLRSAQSYGIGSRGTAITANAGYGTHFTRGSAFTLFADTAGKSCAGAQPDCKPGDYIYNASNATDVLVQTYSLGNGITVDNFCAYSDSWHCAVAQGTGIADLSSLDIVFARPNPDAFMSTNGAYSSLNPITKACIRVASQQQTYRYVAVGSSGLITANAVANSSQCP